MLPIAIPLAQLNRQAQPRFEYYANPRCALRHFGISEDQRLS